MTYKELKDTDAFPNATKVWESADREFHVLWSVHGQAYVVLKNLQHVVTVYNFNAAKQYLV